MAVISPCRVCSAPAYDSPVCGLHSDDRFSYAIVLLVGTVGSFAIIDKHRGKIAWCESAQEAAFICEGLNDWSSRNQNAA